MLVKKNIALELLDKPVEAYCERNEGEDGECIESPFYVEPRVVEEYLDRLVDVYAEEGNDSSWHFIDDAAGGYYEWETDESARSEHGLVIACIEVKTQDGVLPLFSMNDEWEQEAYVAR